ncbi:MAG: DUF1015 domain-containing protein [Actinomycetaceae bacterium]|nr:DUF1015 domain-containing protein [Actinomycetaceae bacterium]
MSTARVFPANVGLPAGADLFKWCVIAADQFSSSPAYWESVEQIVEDSPSTLRMIVPEVFLAREGEAQLEARVAAANAKMDEYRESVLEEFTNSVMYVERATSHVARRRSLVVALDLEAYSYTGEQVDVRASEATVLERIPAREAVRRAASLELPHVQVLFDDPERQIEALLEQSGDLEKVYDTPLMLDGGSVKGWRIDGDSKLWQDIKRVLDGLEDRHGFRFIVGDGNHSLAAAKSHWEHLKPSLDEGARESHPARFALVELLNVHDEGLTMEPIHRFVRGISFDQLKQAAQEWNTAHEGVAESLRVFGAGEDSLELVRTGALIVEPLQLIIDELIAKLDLDPAHACEYVHGEEELARLVDEHGGIGIGLPALDRSSLFEYVAQNGAMPRKSFSLGEAEEKRYYLETRAIV